MKTSKGVQVKMLGDLRVMQLCNKQYYCANQGENHFWLFSPLVKI